MIPLFLPDCSINPLENFAKAADGEAAVFLDDDGPIARREDLGEGDSFGIGLHIVENLASRDAGSLTGVMPSASNPLPVRRRGNAPATG